MLSVAPNISPFSTRQNYTLIPFPTFIRPPGVISAWESDTLEFLSSVYASAYFQIAPRSGQRRKLDAMNHAGLLYKYQLQEGQNGKKINIAASRPFNAENNADIKSILKALVFTQLVTVLQSHSPVRIIDSDTCDYEIIINNSIFSVIILRDENPALYIPIINSLTKCFIVSESLYPEFTNITIPARIALDEDLLSSPKFYLPDGVEEAC